MPDNTQMEPTIYAAFNNAADAEKAASAMMDRGVRPEKISLIVSEGAQKARQEEIEERVNFSHNQTVVKGSSGLSSIDPFHNDMRDSPLHVDPAPNLHDLGAGQETLAFNPAQDDYPRGGTGGPSEFSSAPPNAARDFNKDLDRDYNRSYDNDVERENQVEAARDIERRDESIRTETTGDLHTRTEEAGVQTTNIEEAGEGAKKGALWGLGVGALAAVAALTIPGVGMVLGGGALAAASAALAAGAGAGAVAGGIVGFLKEEGVPSHDIPHYQRAVESGGAVLAIHVDSTEDRAEIESVLRKHGAHITNSYGYAA